MQHVLDRNLLAHVCYRKWTPVDRGSREAIGQWTRSRLAHPSLLLPASVLRLPKDKALLLAGGCLFLDFLDLPSFLTAGWGLGDNWALDNWRNWGRTASDKRDSASHLHLM